MKKQKAFTLIELLVVIAIISLLLSIVMPALKKVRGQAKEITCRSRLKQMALAMSLYADENRGKGIAFPAVDVLSEFWYGSLAPYLGTTDNDAETLEIILCPETATFYPPVGQMTWIPGTTRRAWYFPDYLHQGQSGTGLTGGYGINLWTTTGNRREFAAYERNFFPTYSVIRGDIPVFADMIWPDAAPDNQDFIPRDVMGGGYSGIPYEMGGRILDIAPPTMGYGMGRVCIARHGYAVNIAYVDNHVGKVELEGLWTQKWHLNATPNFNMKIKRN